MGAACLAALGACFAAPFGEDVHALDAAGADAEASDGQRAITGDAAADGGAPQDADASWVDPGFACHFADAGPSTASPVQPVSVSGTRIKPRFVVLEDGTKFLYEIYDALLDAVCDLKVALDGVLRCVPAMARLEVAWADPTCTKRAASAPPSCPPVRFVDTGVYRAITPSATYYSPTCTPTTPTFTGDLFAVGEVVPPSSFVGFKDERVKLTPEIDVVMKVGDDGSRIFLGDFYDVEHDVPAEIFEDRLLPVPNAMPSCCGEVADPITCNGSNVAPTPLASGGCPVFTMPSSATLARVAGSSTVFRSGPPVASLICPIFSPNPKMGYCVNVARSPAGSSRALQVSRSCFAPVGDRPTTVGRIRPSGRSMPRAVEGVLVAPRLRRLTWPPYARETDLALFDTTTGKPCSVVRTRDGKYRCADVQGALVTNGLLFTDPACTTPTALDTLPLLNAELDDVAETCPERGAVRIFQPAPWAQSKAQSFGFAADGTCIPLSLQSSNSGVATEIAPTAFPDVEIWVP